MIRLYSVEAAQSSILSRSAPIDETLPGSLQAAIEELFGEPLSASEVVARVLKEVRQRGDDALREWTWRIDGVRLDNFTVSGAELAAAADRVPGELFSALDFAAQRIREFHGYQPIGSWTTEAMGGRMGQRVTPLNRVGVYVPGGTAPLPSSLLMSVIPAQVAGVREIVVASPPQKPTGRIPDVILAAARIAGIETVYTLGGAQAIAALAYGTESIPAVDKIVGAGNIFVSLAKRQVYGTVGIDGLYGPTETVLIADDGANPAWIAADLLAQAEHDVLACAILLTPSRSLAEAVQVEVSRQIEDLDRSGIISASLSSRGGIVLTADLEEAARLANAFAPEHLCIATRKPSQLVPLLDRAGGLFIGERSFEVLGDYVAGPSHVMPTGGTARFASPLSTVDFVRLTTLIELDDATSALLIPVAASIARSEALTAHAAAATTRLKRPLEESDERFR
jgi:histidinol dehydrogenase